MLDFMRFGDYVGDEDLVSEAQTVFLPGNKEF